MPRHPQGGSGGRISGQPCQRPASQFIELSVQHPDWLRTIEDGKAQAIVALANAQGFACSLENLKQAASDLLSANQPGGKERAPDKKQIDEAASGLSDLEGESGYGDDTGYAALYGVAGAILKLA